MRLVELIQSVDTGVHQGTSRAKRAPSEPDPAQVISDGLAEVRKTNETYFKMYWGLLVAAFVLTLVLALVFRAEIGGIAAVIGSGGVMQAGLLSRISAELKEKTRIETVVVLARTLPPAELMVICKELLAGIGKP